MGIKISQLPVASTSQDTDIIPIVQAGVTKQIQKSIFNKDINDSITEIQGNITNIQNNKEDKSNKVTSISSSSTDTQYPSAKCVYDSQEVQNTNIENNANNIQALENILPKATATGENINIANSADYKFNYFNNGGNTQQDSYEGNQLIDFSSLNKSGNATVSFVNDILTISSTGTSQYAQKNITDLFKNNAGKTLKFVYEDVDISNQYGSNFIVLRITIEGTTTTESLISASLQNTPYTIPNDTSNISAVTLRIWSNGFSSTSHDASLTITKPMLQFGTETKTYEPYVGGTPAPNPDYPQDIISVGSNVNLLDISDVASSTTAHEVTLTKNGNVLNLNGTTSGGSFDYNVSLTNTITLKAGKTYIFQSDKKYSADVIVFALRNGSTNIVQLAVGKTRYVTYTPTEDVTIDKLRFYVPNNKIVDNFSFRLKVEQDLTPSGYTPYNRGGIDVKVENKNLVDITSFKKGYINSSGAFVSENLTALFDTFIKVKENNYYNLSANDTLRSLSLIYYDKNYNFVSRDIYGNMSNKAFLIPSNVEYVLCQCSYNTSEITQEIINGLQIQFEKGESRTSYIAHAEQKVTIPLPVGMELCKIGDYSDKIFHNIPSNPMYNASLVQGNEYKYNAFKKVVLNGTENWEAISTSQTGKYRWRLAISDIEYTSTSSEIGNIICSHYTAIAYAGGSGTYNNVEGISVANGSSYIAIYDETNNTDIDTWKTWLSTHNIEVIYQLATPTYTQITDTDTLEALNTLEKFTTYQGGTNISSDNIPSPIFDVQYFLDLQSLFN